MSCRYGYQAVNNKLLLVTENQLPECWEKLHPSGKKDEYHSNNKKPAHEI